MNKGRGRKSLLIVLVLALLLTGCVSVAPTSSGYGSSSSTTDWDDYDYEWDDPQEVVKEEPKEGYTVMIYMVGSDLESDKGAATRDIDEMLMSGIDLSKNNVVIYTGGSYRWGHEIKSDRNCIIELSEDGGLELVKDYGQILNMGESETLRDFIDYCYENYNTEHYALICWDHGGGPINGYGSDELYGGDTLLLVEMEDAIAKSALGKGERLDWIGFDACIMASVELVKVWKDYAGYLIASQDNESGYGWDYTCLNVLNETDDTFEIAKEIIDRYKEGIESVGADAPITLSCVDLSKVDGLMAATEKLFAAMEKSLDEGEFYNLAYSRNNTKSFAESAEEGKESESFDVVDMVDMAVQLGDEYASETAELQKAMEEAVVYEVSNVNDTCGLSIYYPHNGFDTFINAGMYLYEYLSVADSYSSYITKYTDIWLYEEVMGTNYVYDYDYGYDYDDMYITRGKVTTTDGITMELSDEQAENLIEASYTIMQKIPDGGYYPILSNCRVEIDKNNVIRLPKKQQLLCLKTDLGEEIILPAVQTEDRNGERRYVSRDLGVDIAFDYDITDSQWVTMRMKEEKGQVQVESIVKDAEESAMKGKQDVDLSGYNTVKTVFEEYLPTYDAGGNMLPYSEWDVTETKWLDTVLYEKDFSVNMIDAADMEGELICQIVLRDGSNHFYASDIIELSNGDAPKVSEKNTADGKIEYAIYEDHAEVVKYEGSDKTVEIPEEIEGKTVTVIGEYAFGDDVQGGLATKTAAAIESVLLPETIEVIGKGAFKNCTHLKSVKLSENLKVISNFAFAGCSGMKELIVPKDVEMIGDGAFAECAALQNLKLDSDKNYVMKDGALFTKDMKTLVAYPGQGVKSYKVPDGVEEIADYAFLGMEKLESVEFADSVHTIGIQAFFDCTNYTEVILGDGVKNIEAGAFATSFVSGISGKSSKVMETIYFGKQVKRIAETAFKNVDIKEFKVAPENEVYSSDDGMLLSKAGDVLILCNMKDGSVLKVPEGIGILRRGAFDNCGDDVTEIVLPDSLQVMDKHLILPEKVEKVTVGSGLKNWENIGAFSNVTDLIVSEKNPDFKVVDKVVYSKDQSVLYLYPSSSVKKDTSYKVPEGVKEIRTQAICSDKLEEIVLPSTFEKVGLKEKEEDIAELGYLAGLKSVAVASGNAKYISEDGLLYNKEGKVLLYCPKAKTDTVRVKDGVEELGEGAISYGSAQEIYLPDSLKIIHSDNFKYLSYELEKEGKQCHVYLPDNLDAIVRGVLEKRKGGAVISSSDAQYEPVEGFVVHVKAGSNAEKIAKERGFKIEYIK